MPLYVADYLADTGHLSAAQHGAYLLLIMHYWRQGGLPSDEKTLARIARMSDREWKGARDIIAALFGPSWKHARVDSELEKARDKSDKRAEAGARGGTAKALKTKDAPVANATILPEQKPTVALASSSQPQSEDTSLRSVSPRKTRPRKAEAHPLPDGWQPSATTIEYGRRLGHSWTQVDNFREEMRLWARSKDERKVDWDAALCGWMRRDLSKARAGPKHRGSTLAELAFPELREPYDEQPADEHHTSRSAGPGYEAAGGFAGRLSERDRADSGGVLLDFGPARAVRF